VGYRVQYKESSFQYLKRLAKGYNQWLYFDGTKLYFGKKKDDDTINLTFGSDVTNMQLDYRISPSRFELLNYNPQSDTIFTGESSNAQTGRLDDMSDMLQGKSDDIFTSKKQISVAFHPLQQDHMDGLVTQMKNRLGSQYLTLTGSCNNSKIKIGSLLKISGPNRANPSNSDNYGQYRVIALEQTVSGGGSFQCKFEAISDKAVTPPNNLEFDYVPVEDEFATVTDNKDPEKMGRVKVRHIWQADNEETHWLDTSQMYSGEQRGYYWVPEVGDRVMIGYIHGNPSYPYVKGSMYNKNNKPVHVYEDDNSSKAIALSENMLIHFDKKHSLSDGETEIISITSYDENGTNKHPNYVLVTKDSKYGVAINSQNHMILITGDTIKIKSSGEMNIESGGALNIKSGGAMTLDAGQNDIKIAGMNVKITAQQDATVDANNEVAIKAMATMELTASAKAKFDGGAMTEITGGLIKLN
jgi:uncharacterized protein involved in type VI secretion and phage assembly